LRAARLSAIDDGRDHHAGGRLAVRLPELLVAAVRVVARIVHVEEDGHVVGAGDQLAGRAHYLETVLADGKVERRRHLRDRRTWGEVGWGGAGRHLERAVVDDANHRVAGGAERLTLCGALATIMEYVRLALHFATICGPPRVVARTRKGLPRRRTNRRRDCMHS